MKAKILKLLLPCVGFLFQYIIPIILFGNVIPFTHGAVQAGLTASGYIACGVLLFILIRKLKEWLHGKPKSLTRGIILSIFPIVIWLVINFALGAVSRFLASFISYWHYVIIFIVIGRMFYVMDEAMTAKDAKENLNG